MHYSIRRERPAANEKPLEEMEEREPDWRRAIALTGGAVAVGSLLGCFAMNSAGPPDPTFSVAALNEFSQWEHLQFLFGVTTWVGFGLFVAGLVLVKAQRGGRH